MPKTGYIQKRFKAQNAQAFPSHPVWPLEQPCLGFVSFTSIELIFESLKKNRHNIFGIWSGEADKLGFVTIVAFEKPEKLDQNLPGVLPLQKIRDGHLASFSMDQSGYSVTPLNRLFTLDIWWNGEVFTLNLNALETMPLADLWPLPQVSIFRGTEFKEGAINSFRKLREGDVREDGTHDEMSTKAIVKKALDIKDNSADVFSATDKALENIEERTKLSNIFKRLLNQRTFGKGAAKDKGDGQGEAAGGEPKTSLMEDLAGWVRWHTPLANGLIKQMHDRMNSIEKLINKGDIDSALKLALKLGNSKGKEKTKTRFPFRLPEMRSNLDFNFSGSRISLPVLGGDTQHEMWLRYTKLAEELETKGDHKRAAYIRSQLLENHLEAVLTLERGELFSEAAKLSYDSRQDSNVTIRLYYKAGKEKHALALARRTGCFDKLAEDSRADNPEFHNLVVKFWTDMLLESHQPLRALEVTDRLVDTSKNKKLDENLLDLRRDWLESALELEASMSGEGQLLPFDLSIRALLTAKWDGSDFSPDMLQNFPNATIGQGSIFNKAFEEIQNVVKGKHPDELRFFLSSLFQRADKAQFEQAGFWQGPVRKFLDVLTRSIMSHSPSSLSRDDIVKLQRLLEKAPLPVLSLDLKKVKNFHKWVINTPSEVILPKTSNVRSSQILKACVLLNGSMVVWYDTDRFEHLNRNGKVLWSGKISQVRDIIPIGGSPSVLILRNWGEHETRLTLFESHKRQFLDVGIIHLVAWHDVISDREWLVQIDNVVGPIDITKLFRNSPELEFLWSVNTSNELRIIAFFQKDGRSSWMTRNVSKSRFGVKQVWYYKNTRELEPYYCRSHFEEHNIDQIDWYWGDNTHSKYGYMRSLKNGEDSQAFVSFSVPDAKLRHEVTVQAKKRIENGYIGGDTVQVCDYQRPLAVIQPDNGLKVLPDNCHRAFHLKCHQKIDLRLLYRGYSLKTDSTKNELSPKSILCTDKFGRLIRVNIQSGEVDIF